MLGIFLCIAFCFCQKDRIKAANKIIDTIRSRRPQMVGSVEALCDAYITLANLDATQWKAQRGIRLKECVFLFLLSFSIGIYSLLGLKCKYV